VQAIFHGLAVQRAADPKAIDSREVVVLCFDILHHYLWGTPKKSKARKRTPNNKQKVSHERYGK
jgi:hypothetical protein